MNKKNVLIQEFFREVKKSRNRFLSILVIVFLGVAFFSGIRASGPDMQLSADAYFDEARLMDVRIIGTMGLTEDDIDELTSIRGVKAVNPSYSKDVLCSLKTSQPVLHLMAYTPDMNDLTVVEGNLPEEDHEIFLDQQFMDQHGIKIGDTIRLESGDDKEDIHDVLDVTEYTVTGSGNSPFYMSLDRGTSSIGDGSVAGYGIIPVDSFSMDVYTELYITMEDAEDVNCYGDEYKEMIDDLKERLEILSRGRCKIRYASVTGDGKESIDDAQQEILDARKQLEDARTELEEGTKLLNEGKEEFEKKEQEFLDGKSEFESESGKLEEGRNLLEQGKKEADSAQALLDQKEQELKDAQNKISASEQQLSDGRRQVEEGEDALADAEQEIRDNEQKITDGETAIAQGRQKIETLESLVTTLAPAVEVGKSQIEEYGPLLDEASGKVTEYEDTLEKKREELDGLKADLEELKKSPEENAASIKILEGSIQLQEKAVNTAQSLLDEGRRNVERIQAVLQVAEESIRQYDEAAASLETARTELSEKEGELSEGKAALQAGKDELNRQKEILKDSKDQVEAGQKQLDDGKRQLEDGQRQLEDGRRQLDSAKEEISSQSGVLSQGQLQLDAAKKQIQDGEDALEEARDTLEEKEEELSDGWDTYYEESADAEEKIAEGEEQIRDAQEKLEKLEEPVWYVLGRDSIQTYVEYEQDTQRIVAIARVFPVIFFLVAALICLTTMTRMVEENRTQIGTLKALGYGKMAIAGKYLSYAFLASIMGSVAGFILGQLILPRVVIGAYAILYTNLPVVKTPVYLSYSIGSTLIAVGITVVAAGYSCFRELQEVPSQLMRPEPPKNGKRIFLEHIPFIWNHLSFSKKATARNLFRYKKRFFMTVLGIGGCMGLLMTGFGLKDSIMVIGEKQFGEIRVYSSSIALESDNTESQTEQLLEEIEKDPDVKDYMMAYETSADISANDVEKTSYMVVAPDTEQFKKFVVLKDRLSKEEYQLDDEGVIITEKLAKLLNVKAGDSIMIKDGETKKTEVKISHVVENYFFHYIYMTPKMYEKIYGEEPEYTEVFTINRENSPEFEKQFQARYMEKEGVLNVSFLSSIHDRIKDMLKSMDTVIYVIVIAAGTLAFVVLYNLNNINISERRRELATLKVLGFYDMEVSNYVFRENIILTVIGTLLGIVFGLVLHRFMIITAEIDIMMFGRNIKIMSFIYSICLTFLFSFLVNLFMHFKLKTLDMVESMKSVE